MYFVNKKLKNNIIKYKKIIYIILVLFNFNQTKLYSSDPIKYEIPNLLESVSFVSTQNVILDKIDYYSRFKLNLRICDANELSKLPTINFNLAEQILSFVKNRNIKDYQIIADSCKLNFEQLMVLKLCTFIPDLNIEIIDNENNNNKVNITKIDTNNNIIISDNELKMRYRLRNMNYLSDINGVEKNKFVGNELDLYQRFDISYSNFDFGILLNKDVGEEKIYDFTSYFLSYNFDLSKQNKNKLLIGDFTIEAGMGNIFWPGMSARKGADVINPVYSTPGGIFANRSSIETQFMRGLALDQTIAISNFFDQKVKLRLQSWFSQTPKSGNLDTNLLIINSIYKAGYYRTESEISKKNTLHETSYGAILEFNIENLKIGYINANFEYDKNIYTNSIFNIYGNNTLFNSMYLLYENEELKLANELSFQNNNTKALKSSLVYKQKKHIFAIHYRNYSANFYSPYSSSFTETNYTTNEEGIYISSNYKISRYLSFNNYIDFFKYKIKGFAQDAPALGNDFFTELEYKIDNFSSTKIRLKYENKSDSKNNSNTSKKQNYQRSKYALKLNYQNQINDNLLFLSGFETNYLDFQNVINSENGLLIFSELSYNIMDNLELSTKLTYFSTTSFESAIWQYEYAVQGLTSSTSLYGDGRRFIMDAIYKYSKNLKLTARYSSTYKFNESKLGVGDYQLLDNNDNRFYFQIDLSY